LPPGWDADKRNVVVFGSSEDEFAAIGAEWDRRVYPGQAEALRRICSGLAADPAVQVTLRLHPNMAGLDRGYARELLALDGSHDNLHLVRPESDVSTYALLDAADTVVTFGSTLGVPPGSNMVRYVIACVIREQLSQVRGR